jgi:hypothetical protein
MIDRPQAGDFLPYFGRYIDKVGEDAWTEFDQSFDALYRPLAALSEEQADYAYDEGKWSIKAMLQHIMDTERVFSFRAMHFARQDATPLPGFEQDDWQNSMDMGARKLNDMLEEYRGIYLSARHLFKSFTDRQWSAKGFASGHDMSVMACFYILAGHRKHHLEVLQDRYFPYI